MKIPDLKNISWFGMGNNREWNLAYLYLLWFIWGSHMTKVAVVEANSYDMQVVEQAMKKLLIYAE